MAPARVCEKFFSSVDSIHNSAKFTMTPFPLPSPESRTIAVLGGGFLGRRIACARAAGGFDVLIHDPNQEQRVAAVHYCRKNLSQYSRYGNRGSVIALDDLRTTVTNTWLVVEAIPENLTLKISIFADLEKLTPSNAILCSNSSCYKTREMVRNLQTTTKHRTLNMHHYMSPVNRIVELMTDGDTDGNIFPFLVQKLESIGMHPYIAHRESTGMIFHRIWAAINREVLGILVEGISRPGEVDRLWLEALAGHKSGPVAMMDAVGLDTASLIEQHYIAERGLTDTAVRFLEKHIGEGKEKASSAQNLSKVAFCQLSTLPPFLRNRVSIKATTMIRCYTLLILDCQWITH